MIAHVHIVFSWDLYNKSSTFLRYQRNGNVLINKEILTGIGSKVGILY